MCNDIILIILLLYKFDVVRQCDKVMWWLNIMAYGFYHDLNIASKSSPSLSTASLSTRVTVEYFCRFL